MKSLSHEELAKIAEKAADADVKAGNFDKAAGEYETASDQYEKASDSGKADNMRDAQLGALASGSTSYDKLDAEAKRFEDEAQETEIRAAASLRAGRIEGSGGTTELFEEAAVKRLKSAVRHYAVGFRLVAANDQYEAAKEFSAAANSYSEAAQDHENAADNEPTDEEAEAKDEYRAAFRARDKSMFAHNDAERAFKAAGYLVAADEEHKRSNEESDQACTDWNKSVFGR
jgi:hypothetical protein